MRAPVPATASTARRVSVATPERRCRKLRATRSPASSVAAVACTRARMASGPAHSPSAHNTATRASGSSTAYTCPTTGNPATTKRPSATNSADAGRSPAGPSSRVVTSSAVRSSCRASRTCAMPSGSANRQHPVDGAAGAAGDSRGNGDVVLQVAERIAELLERDQLHEAALRRLRQRMKLLGGILAAQPVQHPGLGRHHEASRRRAARPLHHLFGRNDVGAAGGHITVRRGIVHRARDTAALGMHQELRIRMLAALDLDLGGPERREHPDAEFLVHPECGCVTSTMYYAAADGDVAGGGTRIVSTEQMMQRARSSPARRFVVATETGVLYRLRRENPDRKSVV